MVRPFDPVQDLAVPPATREQTWALVRHFVGTWQRAIEPGDGYSDDELDAAERELHIRLPAALREAYALLGRRTDLTNVQDRLLAPDQLELDDQRGVLVFRYENQGVTRWGITMRGLEGSPQPDPSVVWEASGAVTDTRPSGEPLVAGWREWRPWLDRVSSTFLEIVLSESWVSARHKECLAIDDEGEALLYERFSPLAIPPYPLWAAPEEPPVRWFGHRDVLGRYETQGWLWIQARTPSALDTARHLLLAR
jgi:hypothetical protein